jgi:hypothetical protein
MLGVAIQILKTSSITTSQLRGGEPSPLDTYFKQDNQGLSIFDYAAIGSTPNEKPSLVKINTISDESANPGEKTTLQNNLEQILKKQDQLQEYFTGRKVYNDCKTFPYCNHIPAPPPLLPPPEDLAAPNPNIWYPWQPRIKSQNDVANARQDDRNIKSTIFHPWFHHREIGQKWEHDPNWETPFERPGVVPRLYNRQYQLHMYPNNIGAVVDNDASGPSVENPPSGPYTSESESGKPITFGPSGAENQPLNAGQRGAIPPHTTDYQPPNLANQAWDGEEIVSPDASGPEEKDQGKDDKDKA